MFRTLAHLRLTVMQPPNKLKPRCGEVRTGANGSAMGGPNFLYQTFGDRERVVGLCGRACGHAGSAEAHRALQLWVELINAGRILPAHLASTRLTRLVRVATNSGTQILPPSLRRLVTSVPIDCVVNFRNVPTSPTSPEIDTVCMDFAAVGQSPGRSRKY